MVTKEHMEFKIGQDRAILSSETYFLRFLGEADQPAVGLPQFVTQSKDEWETALKTRRIELLQHKNPKRLYLFTVREEHYTGASYIIETIHRFVRDMSAFSSLPSRLYVQVDNSTRKNKIGYTFPYMASLTACKVFWVIEASFFRSMILTRTAIRLPVVPENYFPAMAQHVSMTFSHTWHKLTVGAWTLYIWNLLSLFMSVLYRQFIEKCSTIFTLSPLLLQSLARTKNILRYNSRFV